MPWTITGQVEPHARPGVDAEGWLWELRRGDDARRVLLEISRRALAADEQALPRDTATAIRTEGRSQLEDMVELDEPPRVIVCSTDGCRARPQKSVRLGH
jgi:hypothetical protein